MAARTLVLSACAGLIAALASLTVSVLVREGIDVLVVTSLVVIALLGFGVLGALTHPPDE